MSWKCKIFGHDYKFFHLRQICDAWWVGTERIEDCSRCRSRKVMSFSSSRPLTKQETEKYQPDLIRIED